MECCGKDRQTKYCPECGRLLCSSPLEEVTNHCIRQLEMMKRHTAMRLRGNQEKKQSSWYKKKQRNIEKWEAWVSALLKAIEMREQYCGPRATSDEGRTNETARTTQDA